MKHSKAGVLLDSNVWRYVIDNNASGELVKHAREGRLNILIAPAVVYEALRLKDSALRSKLVRLMTHRAFSRLMPEAYSEALELLHEIKRLHPGWIRTEPDLQLFSRLQADWQKVSGGFWVRSSKSPGRVSSHVIEVEADLMANARAQAQNARNEMKETDSKSNQPMDKISAMFMQPTEGWRGDAFEAWRMDGYSALTHSLRQKGNAYRDWLSPFVDLDGGLLESADWTTFWIYDVEKRRLPRQWLRWAFSFAQRFRKVTSGTPGDSQLSTYFLDSSIVISADRVFIEILDSLRPYAPCELPVGHLIPGGPQGVESLFELLGQ